MFGADFFFICQGFDPVLESITTTTPTSSSSATSSQPTSVPASSSTSRASSTSASSASRSATSTSTSTSAPPEPSTTEKSTPAQKCYLKPKNQKPFSLAPTPTSTGSANASGSRYSQYCRLSDAPSNQRVLAKRSVPRHRPVVKALRTFVEGFGNR